MISSTASSTSSTNASSTFVSSQVSGQKRSIDKITNPKGVEEYAGTIKKLCQDRVSQYDHRQILSFSTVLPETRKLLTNISNLVDELLKSFHAQNHLRDDLSNACHLFEISRNGRAIIQLLTQFQDTTNRSSNLLFRLFMAYKHENDLENASATFNLLLSHFPNSLATELSRLYLFEIKGQYQELLTYTESHLSLNQIQASTPFYQYFLALAQYKLGRLEISLQLCQKGIERYPTIFQFQTLLNEVQNSITASLADSYIISDSDPKPPITD